MRWDQQRVSSGSVGTLPGLEAAGTLPGLVRTVAPPEFAGMTFHEVMARSALNQVPDGASVPFRWTVNPYRGCSHACVYCFARNTHTYLDLDPGSDFDRQVVVKVNVADVLTRELGRRRWCHEHVALGTNTDPYQRAEGRYQLMPGIIGALHQSGTPFSVLTKGTLILRDLALLRAAAADVPVSAAVSVGSVDAEVWREIEPGTPAPARRLDVCAALNQAGIPCGVLMAPVLPGISDGEDQIAATVEAAADAGATYVTGMALHLRPGAREWYARHIGAHRADLVPLYRRLYGQGRSYAPAAYRRRISESVAAHARRCGIGTDGPRSRLRSGDPTSPTGGTEPVGTQLRLA